MTNFTKAIQIKYTHGLGVNFMAGLKGVVVARVRTCWMSGGSPTISTGTIAFI